MCLCKNLLLLTHFWCFRTLCNIPEDSSSFLKKNYIWAFSSAYLEMEIPKYKTSASVKYQYFTNKKHANTHTYKYTYLHTFMCVEYNEGIILEA